MFGFERIGKFHERDNFGVCMFEQNIVLCRGKIKNFDDLVKNLVLKRIEFEKCHQILVSLCLHVITVPDVCLKDGIFCHIHIF